MKAKRMLSVIVILLTVTSVLWAAQTTQAATKPIVTFVELGSVNCVPCRAMQPVLDSIRKKYSDQVSVLFYDVWTDEGEPYARQYKIRVIPTQVFLDKDGKEYYRHEGYLPEEDIKKILKKGGVKL